MTKIELIYDENCPNVETTRAHLKKALADLSMDIEWIEFERTQSSVPSYVRHYGSPTILIDGNPIGKQDASKEGNSCSIYQDEHGNISRVPSIDQIRTAIGIAFEKRKKWPIIGVFSSGVSSILALIPLVSCPLCWPVYTSFLSALGIGFFNYSPYLIPLLFGTVVFVCFLMWRNYHFHKQIIPFLLALSGGTLIVLGKILFPSAPLMYAGIVLLLVSTITNIFYIKKITNNLSHPCEGCYKKMEKKNE